MRVEHFHNATCIVESRSGVRVLCDPWFTDGAFVGSWCLAGDVHRIPTADDFDVLYISHVHPDHFDETYLATLPACTPVVAPREAVVPILVRNLQRLGFTDIRTLDDRECLTIEDLTVTLFEPFQRNPFDVSALLPNFIDSAVLFDDGHNRFLNTNDNLPTPDALRSIEAEFGVPDVVTLRYNSAGFYPQCVVDLSHDEKLAERDRALGRAMDRCAELAHVSCAPLVMPFAGDYALGGSLARLNRYLPASTPHVAASMLNDGGRRALALGTGGVLDVGTGEHRAGEPYTLESAEVRVADLPITYPYENAGHAAADRIDEALAQATVRLRSMQERLDVFPNYRVRLCTGDGELLGEIDTSRSGAGVATLTCFLDERLLLGILERRYHWDNAQIGCHIDFARSNHPEYSSDLHTILSFLHI